MLMKLIEQEESAVLPDLLAFYITGWQLPVPAIGVIAVKASREEPVGLSTEILRIPCSIAAVLQGVSAAC